MKNIFLPIIAILVVFCCSCIEDGIDTSPASQPVFSVDTLDMGVTFTGQPTPTSRFTVRNPHSKILSISRISLRDGADKRFRLNVDGFAGTEFNNVEIRPNDSIYVFVEATLPVNSSAALSECTSLLDFTTNGVTRSVVLLARGQDVDRRHGAVITADTVWTPQYPFQIFDSLVVAPGATLTLRPGVTLHFHDKAYMRVYGSLLTEGTTEAPVQMCGDRTGNVVGSISFDLMASQWEGVHFAPESRGNRLSHTSIRNTVAGIVADSLSQVSFLNCRLRNSAGYALTARYADISLTGTEVAEASSGVMALMGGNITVNHCTIANYYLFSALGGEAVQFYHWNNESDNGSGMPLMSASFSNTVIYGNGTDLSEGDFSGADIYFRRCALKSAGDDDGNFINCLWDTDPLYGTIREEYLFDYRLREGSPLIGAADPSLTLPEAATDSYGVNRLPQPSIGAYQMMFPEEE